LGLALEEPNDQDEIMTVDGLEVRVEKRAAGFVAQSVVDYIDSVWGRGFTIRPASGDCC
jgi:Fe-S cluster assembly iron-binding protein IscA